MIVLSDGRPIGSGRRALTGGGRAMARPDGAASPHHEDNSPASLGLHCDDRRYNHAGDWGPVVIIGVLFGLVISRIGVSLVTHFVAHLY